MLSDQDYLDAFNDPSTIDQLEDAESVVIPFSIEPEVNDERATAARQLLKESGQLASGTLLIQSPYDTGTYVSASEAIETFAVAKYHHFAVVASFLGARSLRVTDAKVERTAGDAKAAAKVGAKTVGVDAHLSADIASDLKAQLALETDFAGSDPDPDEALAYIREHNLLGEHSMTALVALRRGKNPVLRYQLTLDATKESQMNIDSALKVSAGLPKLVDVGGTFAASTRAVGSIKITTEITFPKPKE
ncbi:hypothetical protein GCM10009775_36680 [Microbacterium aoyamense]|uniref:Uncharacterized protein n=1 Tax=Microbacterium aoyamense TaxID=344166 RepID=A0ABN2Q225_9MICO|nr:hypothetical protein [Microbacterium aoyamense]